MSLGKVLHTRRVELAKSLEQISAATRIHIRILKAIEEDHYAELPARAFTRGFITAYCKALKLNPEQILTDHHDFLESKFAERQDRDQGHHGYAFEGKELEQNKRGLYILAGVAGLFAIIVLLVFKPQNHKRKEKHKELTQTSAKTETSGATAEDDEVIDLSAEPSLTPPETSSPPALSTSIATSGSAPLATPLESNRPLTSAETPASSVIGSSVVPSSSPKPSPTPLITPQPTVTTAQVISTPTINASASPSASPTPVVDTLNKGDDLKPPQIKRKIALEALEDVYVKYRSDQRPATEFVLRKGRFLVIKATETLQFEAANPAALRYRTKTREYFPLEKSKFTVQEDGSLAESP